MRLFRSTILISIVALLSRLLGVWRENLLASQFGGIGHEGSNPLDAYYAAFRIPDFLYNLVIMSVGAAIFVPIFARELQKNKDKINQVLNNFLNVAAIMLVVSCGLIYLTLPWWVNILTIGFSPENKELTGQLMKIMLLSPLLFGLSSIVGSYLSVYKNFTSFTWSPIVYNLGIIFGTIFLVPQFGVYGVAIGVIVGAFCHLAVQFPSLWKQGYRYQWFCSLKPAYIQEVKKLVLPRIIGISASQINLTVDTVIASTLVSGSLTILNWTQNIQYLPIGLIGISISITAFTLLSDYAAAEEKEKFTHTLLKTMRMIIFLSVPATVGFFILRGSIVDLIFNYGKFGMVAQNATIVAETLGYFILSLLFQGLIPLFTRAFYAYQDTKTPVISALITVVINIAGSLFFAKYLNLGVEGLAISFTIANTFNALMLVYLLHKKFLTNLLQPKTLLPFLYKVILASVAVGVLGYLIHISIISLGHSKLYTLIDLCLTSAMGALVFLGIAKAFHMEEMTYLLSKLPFGKKEK